MAVRASLLFKTVQNFLHCIHSTWPYAHKWCNTLQRVFPSKRRAHWSSKNIMRCGGVLSPDGRMRPLFHWEPSPLATWVTISGGRAIQNHKILRNCNWVLKGNWNKHFPFSSPTFLLLRNQIAKPTGLIPQEKMSFSHSLLRFPFQPWELLICRKRR